MTKKVSAAVDRKPLAFRIFLVLTFNGFLQYFSGHYQWMGLNVLAMVDSKLCFMYAANLKSGRSSDYKAYLKSSLFSWIESLPLGILLLAIMPMCVKSIY
jgi:hypothetical protein